MRRIGRRQSRLVWTEIPRPSGQRLVKVEVTMKGDTTKAATVNGRDVSRTIVNVMR